jgi:hypothetical protein
LSSGGELADKYPMRAGFPRCCPRAASGHAAAKQDDKIAPSYT